MGERGDGFWGRIEGGSVVGHTDLGLDQARVDGAEGHGVATDAKGTPLLRDRLGKPWRRGGI